MSRGSAVSNPFLAYPADEAATSEQIRMRMTKAPDYFICGVENDHGTRYE